MTSPLAGQRVVICRSDRDAKPLIKQLESLGAAVVSVPLVEPRPAADNGAALRDALGQLDQYEWLVTTSANGSRAVLEALSDLIENGRIKISDGRLGAVRVACVGSATARAFLDEGVPVALRASVSSASGLVMQFDKVGTKSRPKVLAPLARLADDELEQGLTAKGYEVRRVEAYHTMFAEVGANVRKEVEQASAVLFTSSSTVTRFAEALGTDLMPALAISIGPKTSATMSGLSVEPTLEATSHTQLGVIEALLLAVRTMKK